MFDVEIARFQNPADNPYTYYSGAVAVLCNTAFNEEELAKTLANTHSNEAALYLMVVRSDLQMKLVRVTVAYEEAGSQKGKKSLTLDSVIANEN